MKIGDVYDHILNSENIGSWNAMVIDIYSITKILDFYNAHMLEDKQRRLNQHTTTLITVIMNFIVYEVMKCENMKIDTADYSKINGNLRHAVHQFRRKNFNNRDIVMNENMGISTDEQNPMLDFILYFIKEDKNKKFIGTNIWEQYVTQNNFGGEVNYQQYTDVLMSFFRTIHDELVDGGLADDDYCLRKINKAPIKIIEQPYSFVSLIRKSKIKQDKLLKRLLIAYSQLSTIDIIFKDMIDLNDDEIKDSYIIYFFSKMVAYVLDETYDNVNSYLQNTQSIEEKKMLGVILDTFKNVDCENNRKLRNNFHYISQDKVFTTKEEIVTSVKNNLQFISNIISKIEEIINIKDRKLTYAFFRLLRWTEYGYEGSKSESKKF